MSRLIFYSDQVEGVTDLLDDRLPRSAKIGYLPSAPDPDRFWFRSRQAYYRRLGADVEFFGLEEEFDPSKQDDLFACDAIHMTGGNTFRFLYWLRRRGLVDRLRKYEGVLVGLSAGAILMTPDISTSYLCGDIAYPELSDYKGLSLVDFAFVPHVGSNLEEVRKFSLGYPGEVLAVPDGSGIVVDGEKQALFGPSVRMKDGVDVAHFPF